MKLSLWQQFSSNHSGSYRIIGVFKTEAQAQQAQATLTEMMLKIMAFNALPERLDARTPTPLEAEYAKTHHIEWEETISWLRVFEEDDFQPIIDEHLSQFGQQIVIDSQGETFMGEDTRIRELVGTLDAEVYHNTDYTDFQFGFVCHAPDPATAQSIYENLQRHLYNPNTTAFFLPPPWTLYHPLGVGLFPGLTQPQYAALTEAWQTWYEIVQAHSDGESETLRRQLWRMFEEVPMLGRLQRIWVRMSLAENWIKISLQDQQIHVDNEGSINLLCTMSALHGWFTALGCHVTYTFVQEEEAPE